jgi:hypothetical protein
LHPATGQGFAAFHACRLLAPPGGDAFGRDQFPRRGSHPSKSSPRQQPYRITAAVAFLSFLSCPTPFPAEAEVVVDRHPTEAGGVHPKFLPGLPVVPAPRGWVAGFPRWPFLARDGVSDPPKRPRFPATALVRWLRRAPLSGESRSVVPTRSRPGAVPPKRSVSLSR